MNALTSPAITELTTESAPLNLLGEWLRGWFNGSLHQVGSEPVVRFPAVNLAFNQSAAVQPLYQFGKLNWPDTTIRVVILPRTEEAQSLDTVLFSGKLATARVLLNFYITAKHPGPGEAQQSAQTVASLLKAILTNPDSRYLLALRGITAFTPEPVRVIPGEDYAQRLVACGVQLQYPIRFGDQPLPLDGVVATVSTPAWPQSVEFFMPTALVAGEYLMGKFTAACPMRLSLATAVAFAPQTSPVVMGLEINGGLTGDTLTLAVNGVPNQEAVDRAPVNRTLAVGDSLRWKVISAPAPAASAWRATVEVTATPMV